MTRPVAPLVAADVLADIAAARRAFDVVVPFVHWGPECVPQPDEADRHLARRMIDAGADKVGWLPLTSGPGNYRRFTMDPTDRKVKRGDIIWTNAGCSVNGYWSDFNRVAAVDKASKEQKDAYKVVWDLTYEVLDAIKAGVRTKDVAAENTAAHKRRGIATPGNIPGRVARATVLGGA